MKRRTNLFYTGKNIDESNFLTFSNYTEHLTGVALATEFKLFPSRFLCFYSEKLNNKDEKENFIKNYLIAYYENKLAFLRDVCYDEINQEKSGATLTYPDRQMRYLGYLIKAIKMFDEHAELVYESTITEQDYNGTFTDIICTIDSSSSFNKGYDLYEQGVNEADNVTIDSSDELFELYSKSLYGWKNKQINGDYVWNGPSLFKTVLPKFDSDDIDKIVYRRDTSFIITPKSVSETSNFGELAELKFNIVIPLYDVVHFNPATNTIITDEAAGANQLYDLNYVPKTTDEHSVNVPYGIWFAGETISLKRADFKKYAPSWSLVIGTQFKPFPNSDYLYQDNQGESKMAGFVTFSQVLSQHNEILNGLIEYKKQLSEYESIIDNKLSYLSTYMSILDNMKQEFEKLKQDIYNHINDTNIHNSKTGKHTWTIG